MEYLLSALDSTSGSNLHNSVAVNNRPMTEEDLKQIEHILAEEIRRKNCLTGVQQYDPEFYAYNDVETTHGNVFTRENRLIIKMLPFLDPSDSMFCSVKGMSTSIDLESSYTSSRPDSSSMSSKIYLITILDLHHDLYLGHLHRRSSPRRRSTAQTTVENKHLKGKFNFDY